MLALILASWTASGLTLVSEEAANPIRKVVTLLQVPAANVDECILCAAEGAVLRPVFDAEAASPFSACLERLAESSAAP